MQTRISLPTDNIYKFYAIFGLLLLISSMVLFVTVYSTFQERAFSRFLELKVLTEVKDLTAQQVAKKELLSTQAKIDASDKETYLSSIGVFLTISLVLIFFGFWRWHKYIQPKQDLLLARQIEKIEIEIKMLNKSGKFTPK